MNKLKESLENRIVYIKKEIDREESEGENTASSISYLAGLLWVEKEMKHFFKRKQVMEIGINIERPEGLTDEKWFTICEYYKKCRIIASTTRS